MFGSLLTRPLKIATRSALIPFRAAHGAAELAEGVFTLVASRVMGQTGQQHGSSGSDSGSGSEPAAWRPPGASSASAPSDAPAAESPSATNGAQGTTPRRARPQPVNGSGTSAPAEPAQQEDESAKRGDPPIESQSGGDAPSAGTAEAPMPAPPIDETSGPDTPQGGTTVPPSPFPAPELPLTELLEAEPVEPAAAPVAADPLTAEPVHVSEEPVLVDEVADPGAEDGAGAQIRIAEPWDGYRTMKAREVIDRLASSSREELAAVELYETMGRKRKSVLAAAERALKQASPPS